MELTEVVKDPVAYNASLTAVTFVLVEVLKLTEVVPHPQRFLPAVSIVIGVVLSLFGDTTIMGFIEGVMIGAAASGIYDLGRKTVAGITS